MTVERTQRSFISRALLATDGSASASGAEALACALAGAYEAILDIVNVLEFEPWRDLEYQVNQLYLKDRTREIRAQLADTARNASARGVRVERHERVGLPSQEIMKLAEELHSDLIVMGTHGRTGLDHVLIGSTAERVVRGAPCPVVTIRHGDSGRSDKGAGAETLQTLAHLLVAVDFSECSREALDYAVQLADRFGSAVTLLHVVEPVGYGLDFTLTHAPTGAALRAEVERAMKQFGQAFEQRGLQAHYEIVPGMPADAVLRVAQAHHSDAIVVGTHGRRGWSHARFGSVAEAIVRQAGCPVFTVRSPQFMSLAQTGALSQPEPTAGLST